MSKIVPNTFQNPNALTDDYMRFLDGDEVKCYLVIVRKTLGWLKHSDRIAKSMIEDMTGLSKGRVDACMKNLCAFGLIVRQAENDPYKNYGIEWALQLDDTKINISVMQERAENQGIQNFARVEKMRSQRQGGGSVAQGDGVVPQGDGGSVAQDTQKPLSKATKEQAHTKTKIIEQANKKIDYLLQTETLAHSSWQGREKMPPALRDLGDEFVRLTGIKPGKKELIWWLGDFSDWDSFGIKAKDIQCGIDYAKEHNYDIFQPASLTKTLRMLSAKKSQPSTAWPEDEYVY